jgi:hypothetical protein
VINIVLDIFSIRGFPLKEASERCFLLKILIKVFLLLLFQYFGYVLFAFQSYIFSYIAVTFCSNNHGILQVVLGLFHVPSCT